MPKFRFKIRDPKVGKDRIGSFTAPDSASAREFLASKGYTIEWLRVVAESKKSLVVTEAKKAQGLELDTEPGNYRPTLEDLWQQHRPGEPVFKALTALGAIIGVVLLLTGWRSGAVSERSSAQNTSAVKIVISGQVVTSDGGATDSKDIKVTCRIPTLPFSLTWNGSEAVKRGGRIDKTVEFETRRSLGAAEVLIAKPGYTTFQRSLDAAAGKPETVIFELGRVVLEPAKKS